MSNLTEIARKNGGDVYLEQKGSEVYECGVYLSTAQLQATVEQVCAPLIQSLMDIKDSMTEKRTHMLANEAMSHYKNIMGKL